MKELYCCPAYNKCKKHKDSYINRSLPCPYPNCEYGIKEDSFIESMPTFKDNKLTKQYNHIYNRKEFKGIDGSIKYIWLREKDSYPSISNIVFNEIGIVNNCGKVESIYHYTTIENLYSILNSNELWLTEYISTKDSLEITHGFDLFSEFDINRINIVKKLSSKDLSFFLSCFSYESNCRTLFNLYADCSKGVSIEFDSNFNIKNNFWYSDAQLLRLMPVVYNDEIKEKIIKYCNYLLDISKQWIDLDKDCFDYKNELISKTERKEIVTTFFKNDMEELLSFFKHKSYEDEREVRWLYKKDNEYINERYGKPLLGVREKGKKKYYTSTDIANRLCPFEEKFDIKLPIKSIILGTNVDNKKETIENIERLFKKNGYENIRIKESSLPY